MNSLSLSRNLAVLAFGLISMHQAFADTDSSQHRFPEARSPSQTDPKRASQLPISVIRRERHGLLSAADDAAIHELLTRVYLAEDSLDAEAIKDAVSTDFVLEDSVTGRSAGRDAFAELVVKGADFRAGNRHTAINIAVSSDGTNRATAVHYLLALRIFGTESESSELPRVLGFGIVRDQLVKEQGVWRLTHRVSDQAAILPSLLTDPQRRQEAARVIVPEPR